MSDSCLGKHSKISLTGNAKCPPATILQVLVSSEHSMNRRAVTYARGNMTAHDVIRHPAGTADVDSTIMAAMARMQRINTREYRLRIRGTSIQKLDFSTSYDKTH